MPWKASSVMDERVRFVFEQQSDFQTMTELCESYGIARETGYYWPRRYQGGGAPNLRIRVHHLAGRCSGDDAQVRVSGGVKASKRRIDSCGGDERLAV
jgi:hypothetical protein